ncbi:MAG: SDR family oxidoreductase [Candidatus Omnitrophota bacterium]
MKNIFITGSTGFLGWDIARNLLDNTDSNVYLLVRGKADRSGSKRILDLLERSYPEQKRMSIVNRIEVLEGDVTGINLGLKKDKYDSLTKEIDVIYHSAALCEFGIELPIIKKINVDGTKNMLDFALLCGKNGQFISFQYVSTVGIAGKTGGVFYENSLDIGQEFNNTYERTKFEAEKLIESYRKKGLSISVYRPSIITGDSKTGEASNFQMLYQPLHFFSLGIFDKIPVNREMKYNLVPVDCVAKAIYLISTNEDNNKNYHVTNPNPIDIDFLLNAASEYFGFKKPKLVSEKEFDYELLRGFGRKLIDPYLPYFNHKALTFDNTNFNKAIEGKGFKWPVINEAILKRLFKYCADVDYIKRKI